MLLVLRRSAVSLLLMAVLTGMVYPLVTTGIGQPFDNPKYFWPRPSATGPVPYNAGASAGSNLGPSNPKLMQTVQERVARLRAADPDNDLPIPVDLVTASGSGLEAYISPAAAQYQAPRVARTRGLSVEQVQQLVAGHTWGRQWGLLGQPRTNVVTLNLALDRLSK